MKTFENIGVGFDNLKKIENRLFDVVLKPLTTTDPETFINPTAFGVYRGTGGHAMGVLGKDFHPQQPKELFNSFIECMTQTDADLSKLSYSEMKGGAKIKFSAPVGRISFKNVRGVMDESEISLNIQTGFDGFTVTSLYLSIYRLICTNGMKAHRTEFQSRYRNTKGNAGKIQVLCNEVVQAIESQKDLSDMIQHLNTVKITKKMQQEYLSKVLKYDTTEDKKEMHGIKRARLEDIEQSIAIEIGRSGGTLWGLLNGITHYTNHIAKPDYKGNDLDSYLYAETGAKLNARAFDIAIAMAN